MTFTTKYALWRHQRFATLGGQHGIITPMSYIVHNECYSCRTVFSNSQAAAQHIKSAMRTGRCKVDQAFLPRPLQRWDEYTCPKCSTVFGDVEDYYRHVATHIDFPTLYCNDCKATFPNRQSYDGHKLACSRQSAIRRAKLFLRSTAPPPEVKKRAPLESRE